ncbi:MAG: dihydrolipoamide acetyltransferase family protein, partial [Thermaerobacterales bacterium]
ADGAAAAGRVPATPSTRRLAREMGIEIRQVTGTGPAGRVTDDDLRAHQDTERSGATAALQRQSESGGGTAARTPLRRPPQPPAPERRQTDERIPLRGMRRTIADRMAQSKRTAAHATHMDEVDVTELVALRRAARPLAEERGIKLTYMPFILKAVAAALQKFPELNSTFDEEAGEIIVRHRYNLGVATDTEAGLMVPVIKDADQKGLFDIAAEVEYLADRARARRVELDDLRGGTFTITNIGALGGIYSTPIINYPEVAILGVHRIAERRVVHQGQIVPRHMLTLALSFDHRVLDGAAAARFLNQVMGCLANPGLLFLE